jgi:RTX calcium-binding nonapeptide repeat (4 copies)
MRRLLGDIAPVQRRRLALGAAVLGLLAVGTALQPPPKVGPRACRADLVPGTVKRDGKTVNGCLLRAEGRTIFVSGIRKGPKRGSVQSLEEVKRRYQGACVVDPGRDYVVVSDGDKVIGSNASERMVGFDRKDTIDGKAGNDCIDLGGGDDATTGRGGGDVIFGGPGNDDLAGGGGDDSIHGGDGEDTIDGGNGADRLFGGAGNDTIRAGAGADVVNAGPGDDVINAMRPGLRSLNCGPGQDTATISELNRGRVHNCETVRFPAG